MDKCPCCSEKPFDQCCGPLLDGSAVADTAEAMMRSRYTAYVKGNIDYIKDTTHRSALNEFDEASAKKWSTSSVWQGLDIISTKNGKADDSEGEVEFVARYLQDGKEEFHHERSVFKKEGRKWFFSDGEIVGPKPFVREEPKIGRNDPCPCGSGKKYKKCCGRAE